MGTYNYPDIDFSGCDLPTDWDTSSNMFNLSNDLHTKLKQRIHSVHLTNSLLQSEYVGNLAVFCGEKARVKLLI